MFIKNVCSRQKWNFYGKRDMLKYKKPNHKNIPRGIYIARIRSKETPQQSFAAEKEI